MPLYVYECADCSTGWENFHPVCQRNTEICPDCDKNADIVIQAGLKPVRMDYYSENLNARITGPEQKRRLMKEKHMEEV